MKKRIVAMLLVLALCAGVFAGAANQFKAELGLKFDFDREKALKFDTAYAQVGVEISEYNVGGDITYVYSVSDTDFVNHFYDLDDSSFFGTSLFDDFKINDRSKSGLYFSIYAGKSGNSYRVTSSTSLNFGVESVLYVTLDEGRFGKPESLTTTVSAELDSIQSFGTLRAYTQIGHVDKFDKDSENNGYLFAASLGYDTTVSLNFNANYEAVLNFDGLKPSAENVATGLNARIGLGENTTVNAGLQRHSACEYEEDNGVYANVWLLNNSSSSMSSAIASVQFRKDNGKLSSKLALADFMVSNSYNSSANILNNSSMLVSYNNTAEKHDVKVDVYAGFSCGFDFGLKTIASADEHLSLDFYNLDSKIKMDLESHTRIGLDVNPTVPSFVGESKLDINGVFFQDLKLTDGVKTVKNGFDFYVPFNGMLEF